MVAENEIHNAGSLLLVGLLASGADEPAPVTIQVHENANKGAKSVKLKTKTAGAEITVRKNALLDFGNDDENKILKVTETTTLTNTETSVSCDPIPTALTATTDTVDMWELYRISSTEIPMTRNIRTVDQVGGNESSEFSFSVTSIAWDNIGHWKVIYPSINGLDVENSFAAIVRGSNPNMNENQIAWGPVKVSNWNSYGNNISCNLTSQSLCSLIYQSRFVTPTLFMFETDENKKEMNRVMRLSGLPKMVAA